MKMQHLYLIILMVLSLSSVNKASAQANNTAPVLKISGEVTHPLALTVADLAKMKRITVNLKERDGKDHSYTGVSMLDVLNLAGVTTGSQLRGENLSKYMLAKCTDGYEVLFSLAEVDTAFTDRIMVLADESDGKPLPTNRGPFRLVVPGEKKPARSAYQINEFVISFAKE